MTECGTLCPHSIAYVRKKNAYADPDKQMIANPLGIGGFRIDIGSIANPEIVFREIHWILCIIFDWDFRIRDYRNERCPMMSYER